MKDSQTQFLYTRSQNGFDYLYSSRMPQIILINPIFKYILDKISEIESWDEWINQSCPEEVEIEPQMKISKDRLEYYYRYYLFLKENEYFENAGKSKLSDYRIDQEVVETNLAETEQISFEVTDKCNLKCRYCGYGELYCGYDKRKGKNLSPQTALNFLDYCLEKISSTNRYQTNKKCAISFYGGEPLLNVGLIKKIVERVKQKKIPRENYFFNMTTNGTLLDQHIDFLMENDFMIGISLDGNERHNTYRIFPDGRQSYQKVLENIKKIEIESPDYFDNRVHFLSVLHKKNNKEEVSDFFKKRFNKEVFASNISDFNINPLKKNEFAEINGSSIQKNSDLPQDISPESKPLPDMADSGKLKRFISKNTGFVFHKYDQILNRYPNKIVVLTGTCGPFQKRIFLTVNGKILPCEKVGQDQYLGMASDGRIDIDFNKVAEHYNFLYKKLGNLCDTCYNSKYCMKCLFFLLGENDKDIKCNEYMSEAEYRNYFSYNISILERFPQLYAKILRHTRIH